MPVRQQRFVLHMAAAFAFVVLAVPAANAGEFIPGVTDVPSPLTDSKSEFVPGVTDVPNPFAASNTAKQVRVGDYGMPGQVAPEEFVAGVTDVPNPINHGQPTRSPELPVADAKPAPVASDRFDWSDAGIAGSAAAAALLLGGAGALLVRNRARLAHQ